MNVEKYYKQRITYWGPGPIDGNGSPSWVAPFSFYGRWDDKQETIIDGKGEVIRSQSTIHYPQELSITADGYLAKGDFADADPRNISGANKIQTLAEVPDLRNIIVVKVAML